MLGVFFGDHFCSCGIVHNDFALGCKNRAAFFKMKAVLAETADTLFPLFQEVTDSASPDALGRE